MIDDDLVREHRARALTPDAPVMRGTAQNPDVYFQARETVNPFYAATPDIVQAAMDRFAQLTGRSYHLFDYVGAPDADRVIVAMGSGAETADETVNYLVARGEKVGLLKVHLFRPLAGERLVAALPATVRTIAMLDRTKEPGGAGEPLYQDVVTAISEAMADDTAPFSRMPRIIGGRYGLSSKEFTPAMIKGIFDEMLKERPKNHFTVGIVDDVSHTSLDYDPAFHIESADTVRAVFWGLGSDGTVSANKNSINIIGEQTANYAQGYFVYDSKKSGRVHGLSSALRAAAHQGRLSHPACQLRSRPPVWLPAEVRRARPGRGRRHPAAERAVWPGRSLGPVAAQGPGRDHRQEAEAPCDRCLPGCQETWAWASASTPSCRPVSSPSAACCRRTKPSSRSKKRSAKTYGKRGEVIVRRNFAAVDASVDHMHQVTVPAEATSHIAMPPVVPAAAPDFVQRCHGRHDGRGRRPAAGERNACGWHLSHRHNPMGEAQYRVGSACLGNRYLHPVWQMRVGLPPCRHPQQSLRGQPLAGAPDGFKATDARWRELPRSEVHAAGGRGGLHRLCLMYRSLPGEGQDGRRAQGHQYGAALPLREQGRQHWEFFKSLPEWTPTTNGLSFTNVKNVQLLEPYFEFSGACAGCGETPYLKLVSQLFGDRTLIANATGCSSIYGGNLPTTPWAKNGDGRGPAWSNSLFEDNAEFGLGMRLTLDKQVEYAARTGQPPAQRDRRGTNRCAAGQRTADRRRDQGPA